MSHTPPPLPALDELSALRAENAKLKRTVFGYKILSWVFLIAILAITALLITVIVWSYGHLT
jgi:hypothetical protein